MLQLLESIFLFDYFRGKKFFFSPQTVVFLEEQHLLFPSEFCRLCPVSPAPGRRAVAAATPKLGGGRAPGFSRGDQGESRAGTGGPRGGLELAVWPHACPAPGPFFVPGPPEGLCLAWHFGPSFSHSLGRQTTGRAPAARPVLLWPPRLHPTCCHNRNRLTVKRGCLWDRRKVPSWVSSSGIPGSREHQARVPGRRCRHLRSCLGTCSSNHSLFITKQFLLWPLRDCQSAFADLRRRRTACSFRGEGDSCDTSLPQVDGFFFLNKVL